MAAAILTADTITLHNIPYVRDIITMRRLLEDIGGQVLTPELRTHKISAANVEVMTAPYELVKTMRASVLALGPLLARFGKARVSLPGGARSARGRLICISRLYENGRGSFSRGGRRRSACAGGRLVRGEMNSKRFRSRHGNVMMAAALAAARP